ncbi:MAG TPA: YfhO family protein, partial [Thermoanaerobaculia bacterium]|nr:YfhO family protein [Thermoanaerobaculia bacterium]
ERVAEGRVRGVAPPYRIAALGWSFIPDTPGAYGLEDVKTTDPISSPQSMRIVRGYLHAVPNDYDQVFGDVSEPFLDFLNIRFVYVPPEMWITDPRFALRHLGSDGAVFENLHVQPRYQLVRRFLVDPSLDRGIPKMNALRDFSSDALVTHVPPQVERRAPALLAEDAEGFHASAGGSVRVMRYEANRTVLDVDSRGWSLLATSDADWPGWRAYWNGKREPVVTVNDAFLGVFVPPGRGTLELRYRPDAFIDGLRISGAGALIALVLLGVRLRRGRSPL